MLTLIIGIVLYVAGFVFLYGVLRVSVRHAIEDLEVRREQAGRGERAGIPDETFRLREDVFTAGN